MSTNYYALLPVKKSTTDRLRKLADDLETCIDNARDAESILFEVREEVRECKVHLGKYSSGWSFLWDANHCKYYKLTLEGIKEFIDDNHAIIVDEHGQRYSWGDFINREIGEAMTTHGPTKRVIGRITYDDWWYNSHRTYAEKHPEENHYSVAIPKEDVEMFKYFARDGFVDEKYNEFHNDEGMRFATYSDFS